MCSNIERIMDHTNQTSSYLWLYVQLIGLNAACLENIERDVFKGTAPANLIN